MIINNDEMQCTQTDLNNDFRGDIVGSAKFDALVGKYTALDISGEWEVLINKTKCIWSVIVFLCYQMF